MVPLFQNYGSILNTQDFQGQIVFYSNTVKYSFIDVPNLDFGLTPILTGQT